MRWNPVAIGVLWLLSSAPAWPQIPSLTPSAPAAAPAPADPYDRTSPHGTVVAFLNAAQDGKWARAGRYLDVRSYLPPEGIEKLAHQLKYVLDNQVINLNQISSDPQGTLDDALPPDEERLATVKTESGSTDLLLKRVDSSVGKVWLFSEQTLKQIPQLAAQVDRPAIEKHLPHFLTANTHFLSLRVWQLFALLLAIPFSFLIASLITRGLVALLRPAIRRITKENAGQRIHTIGGPVRLIVLVLVMHAVAYSILSLPILARQILINVAKVITVGAFAWLFARLTELSSQLALARLVRIHRPSSMAVVHLIRRLLNVCVFGMAAFAILTTLGVNLTALVAGVSVVGIAIAFAAQKTLENLFGGIMIITDEPIRVGDYCKFGVQGGTVEDIGLRSTRFRTSDRTVVSVPNGQLATMNLENFSVRDKILFNPTIGLRYETTADQTRFVLAEIRRLLYAHSKVETATARVRFVKFGDSMLNLEIFAYALTRDFNEFLGVQEDLLLRIMDIVEGAGSGLAFPSQTLYLGKDTGLDSERGQAAAQKIEEWRQKKALPFPDFHPNEIASIENQLPYPAPESVQRKPE